jgi:DNA polymerase V
MRKTLVSPKEFIQSGFTSPADEYTVPDLNLDQHLKRDPEATYPARMNGEAMKDIGILHGSYLLYDRGIEPKNGSIVYVWYQQEKLIRFYEKKNGRVRLYAANAEHPDIVVTDHLELIGVITWSLKCHADKWFPNVTSW